MSTKEIFNLVEEQWIPCLLPDSSIRCSQPPHQSQVREVGIREALVNAGAYTELRAPSPLVTAALHRFLLAVLHRALMGPRNLATWMEIWKAGRFPQNQIVPYLDRWKHRFNLFDEKYPFYQVGGFELDDTRVVTNLAQELAGGNNTTLFDHTYELAADSWPPAVCARWLVANQAFALGFGKGPTSAMFGKHGQFCDAPLVRGATVLLRGNNLFKTLMLNLLVYNDNEPFEPAEGLAKDVPAWERDRPIEKPGVRPCLGWLDLLTWQSRCIRLIPENGFVRFMYYAPGNRLDKTESPMDPMWFYTLDSNNKERAVKLQLEKSLWRDSDSLFAFSIDTTKGRKRRPLAFSQAVRLIENYKALEGSEKWRCSVLGLGTTGGKAASVALWAHEELPVPLRLLENERAVGVLTQGLRNSEDAGAALNEALVRLVNDLGYDRKRKDPQNPSDAEKKATGSLQGLLYYWAELELPFKRFLIALGSALDSEKPLIDWQREVRLTALDAFRKAADNSFGRSARELKARVNAEHYLNWKLEEKGLGVESLREEVKHG